MVTHSISLCLAFFTVAVPLYIPTIQVYTLVLSGFKELLSFVVVSHFCVFFLFAWKYVC